MDGKATRGRSVVILAARLLLRRFKAFDANQDKVISVVDFLQGIVRTPCSCAELPEEDDLRRKHEVKPKSLNT